MGAVTALRQDLDQNWAVVERLLPPGWQDQMRASGLLKFGRKFAGPQGPARLLRTMLLHVAKNRSLRVTCAMARQAGLAEVSDVGLLKRLQKSTAWFTWATQALLAERAAATVPPAMAALPYRWRLVDATVVREPGRTGSSWRLHYAFDARTLAPDEILTGDLHQAEQFTHFTVAPDEVLLADRVYATRRGVAAVSDARAYVISRFVPGNFPLEDEHGAPFPLAARLAQLATGEVGDYPVWFVHDGRRYAARVCAVRQSAHATARAQQRLRQQAHRHGYRRHRAQTLDFTHYLLVLTTLPASVPAADVLACYRYRWQIELAFKRLKSLLRAAPLYKHSHEGMRGWLSAKVFTAVLTEHLRWHASALSPWGYPLPPAPRAHY